MGQDQSQVGASVGEESKSPEELRREIEDTRRDLGDTAAALGEKTDVKSRAREKVEAAKQTVAEKKESLTPPSASGSSAASDLKAKARQNPTAAAAIGALVVGFLIGRATSR
ncbi:MAG TPA: DUF3618 domain-containing protein [Solirubrobacterales bacterium]|jgi:ElaB/YqjD/DUF883 family membrane-anchored ribosome-binding protein